MWASVGLRAAKYRQDCRYSMKYKHRLCIFISFFIVLILSRGPVFGSTNYPVELTAEEKQWLAENKDREFVLGADPYSGFECFTYQGEEKGYLNPLAEVIAKDLGLNIKIEAARSWGEVYSGLQDGSIDILFGANETAERLQFMEFTRPISKNPYAIITRKNSSIHTIGDIDKKNVGFIKSDVIIDILPRLYKNIKYNEKTYTSQQEAIDALKNSETDAFITSGGPVAYDYVYSHPELSYAFKLGNITSDMTLSTKKEDAVLANILDKEVRYLLNGRIQELIGHAEMEYYRKIMNLTPKELEWLKNDGTAVVGVTKDYLPFDYYVNGEYKGISGQIIKQISKRTGIRFTTCYDEFDVLNSKLTNGEIDVLNIAKTEERMRFILYPGPYSTERDIIIGRKESRETKDIFGLEGKKVAVIKGFWHYEHLIKNLTHVEIVETDNIQESLKLVNTGKADYLIENPTVARYYIEEMQLFDLVEKGITSTDSYLYYGISKKKPELASIIDKVIPLLDVDESFKVGYEEVPHTGINDYSKKLVAAITAMGILLLGVAIYAVKLIQDLIKKKSEVELLKQREKVLYTDALTGLHNSSYYHRKIKGTMDLGKFPQSVIIGDMNNLKSVNDSYGHHIGDELLKLFAKVLKETCPQDSIVLRIGGDEFYIILESRDEHQAKIFMENIRQAMSAESIRLENGESIRPVGAFGYCTRYSKEEAFDECIKIADQRMYLDKRQG